MIALDWRAPGREDQPERFLGSRLLVTLPPERLRTELHRLDPDLLRKVYLQGGELGEAAGDLWFAWFTDLILTKKASKSFGGEHWWWPGRTAFYATFVTARTEPVEALLRSAWEDPLTRRNITWILGEDPIWDLLVAVAPHRPDLVKQIWRGTVDDRDPTFSDNLESFPVRLPPGPAFDDLRREMIELCETDADFAEAAAKLQKAGHLDLLLAVIRNDLKAATPLRRARGLTLAGYLDRTAEAEALWRTELASSPGPGWLTEVFEAARNAWADAARMRHWATRLVRADTEAEAWRAFRLLARVADSRLDLFFGRGDLVMEEGPRRRWLNYGYDHLTKGMQKRREDRGKLRFGSATHSDVSRRQPLLGTE